MEKPLFVNVVRESGGEVNQDPGILVLPGETAEVTLTELDVPNASVYVQDLDGNVIGAKPLTEQGDVDIVASGLHLPEQPLAADAPFSSTF